MIAAIGAGKWGMNVVRTLESLGALGAVVEANEGQHATIRGATQAPIHSDLNLALGDPAIKGVAIATPGHTHYTVAKAALEAGKDVFVEKPMVLDSQEGEELVRIAAANGRVLMVGHLLIYQPAVRKIKELLDEGLIGEVRSLHQERLNLGRARAVENVLWSIGVHDVAVVLYLMGSAPRLSRFNGQCVLQPNIEDDVYLHMEFKGGAKAHLHTSWLWPVMRRQLTIVGDKGMLVYDETKQTVTLHRKTIGGDLESVNEGEEVVFEGHGQPLTLEIQHFLDCVADRSTPVSDGASAVDVLRVIEAAAGAENPQSADSQANVVEDLLSGENRP